MKGMIKAIHIYNRDPNEVIKHDDSNHCEYLGIPRAVHPSACNWHIEKNDPECRKQDCDYFKMAMEHITGAKQ